ncbi:ABC-type transport auxiliary lipoprotein family protein [Marivita sp. S2033]|uniref:ABC-type transport auxiliary lipoprotein family protein n=1 Tax=Marivita sp. S2033 TaxID=3373187 RepID=UPI003981C04A
MTHSRLTFRFARASLAVGALAVVTGCSALSAFSDAATPLDVYEIPAPSGISPTTRGAVARDVIVELPTTSGALETDRIMIRPNPLQAQYLPEVRWSEPVPVMVQTLMLRAIESTGAVRYVGRQPLGVSGDYAIVTEVMDFHAEQIAGGDGAMVEVRLLSRLVRERDARIVSSRTFSAEALSGSTDTLPLVEAFSAASDQVFTEVAQWIRTSVAGG